MHALPRNVAVKKVASGIPKCPEIIPARSNNGFGICVHDYQSSIIFKKMDEQYDFKKWMSSIILRWIKNG